MPVKLRSRTTTKGRATAGKRHVSQELVICRLPRRRPPTRSGEMDDEVYARLKKEVLPKKLSAFIVGAIRAKLYLDAKALDVAYQAASKESWRKSLDENWKHVDAERCPK